MTVPDLEALEQRIDQSDRTWTTPQLVEWLAAERGVRVCSEPLGRLLRPGVSLETDQAIDRSQAAEPQTAADRRTRAGVTKSGG